MRSRSRFVAISVILTSTLISIQYSSAAGRSTSAVVNTILNGKGAPKPSLGIDGDFYIDTRSLLLYGPKTKGKWPTPQSIQGPTGPAGNDGRNGSDGKAVATNVSASTGPQGPVGPQGEKGEKGDTGAPGAAGPAGPAGASGSMGPAGPSGANGSNGAQGPVGPTGATGAQGPKGETGTVGPSEVTVIDIPSWTLGSGTPLSYSASQYFGVLQSNKSYQFVLHVTGTSSFSSFVLGIDLVSTGNTLNFSYSRNNIRYASYSAVSNTYTFDIYGTIQIGSVDSSLQIRVIDGFGDSGSNPLTLTGKAYITLVGAIK